MMIGAMAIAQQQTMARLDFITRLSHRDYTETLDLGIFQLEVECHEPKPLYGQPDTTDFIRHVGVWEVTALKKSGSHTCGMWIARQPILHRTCVMNVVGDLVQFERDVMVMKLDGRFEWTGS